MGNGDTVKQWVEERSIAERSDPKNLPLKEAQPDRKNHVLRSQRFILSVEDRQLLNILTTPSRPSPNFSVAANESIELLVRDIPGFSSIRSTTLATVSNAELFDRSSVRGARKSASITNPRTIIKNSKSTLSALENGGPRQDVRQRADRPSYGCLNASIIIFAATAHYHSWLTRAYILDTDGSPLPCRPAERCFYDDPSHTDG